MAVASASSSAAASAGLTISDACLLDAFSADTDSETNAHTSTYPYTNSDGSAFSVPAGRHVSSNVDTGAFAQFDGLC